MNEDLIVKWLRDKDAREHQAFRDFTLAMRDEAVTAHELNYAWMYFRKGYSAGTSRALSDERRR